MAIDQSHLDDNCLNVEDSCAFSKHFATINLERSKQHSKLVVQCSSQRKYMLTSMDGSNLKYRTGQRP